MIRWCLLIWALILSVETQTQIEQRVLGGEPMRYNVHKFMVVILSEVNGLCSGSVVTHTRIVSAAHCFTEVSEIYNIRHYYQGEFQQIALVKRGAITTHPEYTKEANRRHLDLAVLRTEQFMEFNEYIQPIALGHRGVQINDDVIFIGFGKSEPSGQPSGREGTTVVKTCPVTFKGMICAVDTVRATSGDSGGALIFENQLVGITGASCPKAEDLVLKEPCLTVFVNVTANIVWIISQLDDLSTNEIPSTPSNVASMPPSNNPPLVFEAPIQNGAVMPPATNQPVVLERPKQENVGTKFCLSVGNSAADNVICIIGLGTQ